MRIVHNIIVTAIIYLIMLVIYQMPIDFDFLNPLVKTFNDFEFSDIVFSKFRDHANTNLDTNIVLVNIGFLKREDIISRLKILKKMNPKVIGVDVFFDTTENKKQDEELTNIINSLPNSVQVNSLVRKDPFSEIYDSLATSVLSFSIPQSGYVNLITDEEKGYQTVRSFVPRYKINGNTINAFAVQIAKMYSPEKYYKFINRGKNEEEINYERNVTFNTYMRLDIDQLDSTIDKSIIENKIVLFGFLGQNFNDSLSLNDKFFTPMNAKYAGKTYPDMYGVVIHANIISMILNEKFINSMPLKWNILISFIFTFLNISFLVWLFYKKVNWYDEIAAVLLIVQIISFLYLSIIIFSIFSYQFNVIYIIFSMVLSPNVTSTYEEIINKIMRKKERGELQP